MSERKWIISLSAHGVVVGCRYPAIKICHAAFSSYELGRDIHGHGGDRPGFRIGYNVDSDDSGPHSSSDRGEWAGQNLPLQALG